jgi:DAACS family dicarboxylate/amino acid:cation (Na+ or H+) symporter
MKLWLKILIALILGAWTGLMAHQGWLPQELIAIITPLGTIFLNLISMIMVPLVFASMTVGITSIHDPQKLGRIGMTSMLLYIVTTLIAIGFGIFFASILQPGEGLGLTSAKDVVLETPPTVRELVISIFPSNPMVAFSQGNVLQIIVFSLFLGFSINFAGEKGKPLQEVLSSLADVMFRLTSIIMEFSPIGVFAIMTGVTSTFGFAVLVPLLKFLMTYYTACFFHVVIVFCGILYFMAELHPYPFFRGMGDAIMVAFSTCSSSATLPVTMHCIQKNLGVSKSISNFVIPLGATINMNGAAIFQGMSAIFIAQAYGIDLEWKSLLTIILTATLSTIGAAGIPGTGFIMLSVVFVSVGLPIEGLALLAGIDRMREMVSTVLNVLGDTVCAVYVAKREGELDERQYNHEEIVELEGSEI